MSSKLILLVEDDNEFRSLLRRQLERNGYSVLEADNGNHGLSQGLTQPIDLAVLDVDLPGKNGIELCEKLRAEKPQLGILMLTGRAEELEMLEGLQSGADDYIPKPCSFAILLARIASVLRRTSTSEQVENLTDDKCIHHGPLVIDPYQRTASLNGSTISLTRLEFDLLWLFVANPGRAFTRDDLLESVWGTSVTGYDGAVNSAILRLRTKIEEDATAPRMLKAVRGIGYRFATKEEL